MPLTTEEHARRLFDGIARSYEWPAVLFSFGQYGRWRRAAVARIPRDAGLVLDVAAGTGLVARDVSRRTSGRVIALDQSFEMLRRAAIPGVARVGGSGVRLPFADDRFDALTFSYLLRYVDDPTATLAELFRVVRPGGTVASIEFGRPSGALTRPVWNLYALHVMRLAARTISPGWGAVGAFLGPSIVRWTDRSSPTHLASLWTAAGLAGVRVREMSFGAGVVTWGTKP